MLSGQLISLSFRLLIVFNLLLSIGAVWSLQRIDPEIERIYERNVISLAACENMLAAMPGEKIDLPGFEKALEQAQLNITEKGEKETLDKIRHHLLELKQDVPGSRQQLTQSILRLTSYNRNAIIRSAQQAQKLRQAGAWGIVFLSLFFFGIALYCERHLHRTLLTPLQEIASVLAAHHQGDPYRRCNIEQGSGDMQKLLQAINDLLDKRT